MTKDDGRPAPMARSPRGRGRAAVPSAPDDASEDAPGDPESVARAICLRLLTGQPRTRAELATALAKRGVPAEAAEQVLGRFTEVGLIDDAAFATAWVDSRHAGRGLGRRALAAELRRRGVDDRTTADAVATLDPGTEEATARALVRRKLRTGGDLTPEARARRVIGMLARRGYSADLVRRLVREELAGVDELVDSELDVETY
jgi:regulatory protein